MAKLNFNFQKTDRRYEPTKSEILQIEGLALSIEAIVKALDAYAIDYYDKPDMGSVCVGVCNALKLLIDPVIEYLSNYAGDVPTPENQEGEEE